MANNRAAAFQFNMDWSIEDMDDYWYLQNQHVLREHQIEDEDSVESSSLSSSSVSSAARFSAESPFEGAYEGILAVLDDPRKRG